MGDVEVLVQISPRKQTVVRIAEELVLADGWRQAAKERAAVLEGWTIFDIQRARIGLRPADKQRLAKLCRERASGQGETDSSPRSE